MENNTIKIGLFGAGHFGNLHAGNLLNTPFEVTGFYDPDDKNAEHLEAAFGIKRFTRKEELIEKVDAVDIVVPTSKHYEVANFAISQSKHVFIEKPITVSAVEAKKLLNLSKKFDVKIQVGHIERFNPAFQSILSLHPEPWHIESFRMAPFNPRANDVSVIHDLMIHDLDAVLTLVNSEVKSIEAVGKSIYSNEIDYCNAFVNFENGCVANVTASRMHVEQRRSMDIHTIDKLIHVDFLNKKNVVYQFLDESLGFSKGTKHDNWQTVKGGINIIENIQTFQQSNAILTELEEFYYSILENKPIQVGAMDAYQALLLAEKIQNEIGN